MLKYSLLENTLINRRGDYLARTKVSKRYDKDQFIQRLVGKGTLVTETDAVAALNIIENTIIEIIQEGGTLNLPLFNTSFSIGGVFNSPLDSFDPLRHKLNVNLQKGTLLREAEKQVALKKTNTIIPLPAIVEVRDTISGKVNSILTPGGIIEIRGYNIKIVGDDPACGLWFVGNETIIKAEILAVNKPSVLIATIPLLPKGDYQLKVVTQYARSAKLKGVREALSPATLKV